jgi:CBS domain containing-hemolysin-like protein
VNEHLPHALPEDDDYDSVAGLMNVIFEKIPEIGEEIVFGGYKFIVTDKKKNNVDAVKMIRIVPEDIDNAQ